MGIDWDGIEQWYAMTKNVFDPPWRRLTQEARDEVYLKYRKEQALSFEESMEKIASDEGLITHAQLGKIIEDTFEAIKHLNDTKGLEYATQADALANFKRRGADLDIDPMKVWGIFAGKHWDAILAYVRTGKTLSEGITGRIDDLILYAVLLKGLIVEKQGAGQSAAEKQRGNFYVHHDPAEGNFYVHHDQAAATFIIMDRRANAAVGRFPYSGVVTRVDSMRRATKKADDLNAD